MRSIDSAQVSEAVSSLFKDACTHLPDDVLTAVARARDSEESPTARNVLDKILENSRIASDEQIPLCQDTGTAVVFLEIGQGLNITGEDLYQAVHQGVRRGYEEGYLRKSIVERPFSERKNTTDNTPAVIHTDIVSGDKLKITVMPKGGGAENMARLAMLTPAQGRQGIIDFVVKAVEEAGSNPCPPVIVGIGMGPTAEQTMILAKKALLREVGAPNADPENAALEREILQKINNLGIGPMGYGGGNTALAVHIEVTTSHIASMPVGINLQCHSARHKETVL